jgi:hypothetical protein
MTDDDFREVAIAIRDERTSFGSAFGQKILDLIDCKEHYREWDGWKAVGLADMRVCMDCGEKMYEKQIALLPPKPEPFTIKTIYTSLGHRHGGMGISTVVADDGKILEHTRQERVISYDSYRGLVRLGKFRNG